MNGWNCSNKEFATSMAIHYLKGYLETMKNGCPELNIKGKDTVKIDDVFEVIDIFIKEETERLNKAHPDKA